LASGAIFDRRKDSGVEVLRCEPRSRNETPGGPEESRWTKHTYIRICVQSTHVYIYVKRRDEILD